MYAIACKQMSVRVHTQTVKFFWLKIHVWTHMLSTNATFTFLLARQNTRSLHEDQLERVVKMYGINIVSPKKK